MRLSVEEVAMEAQARANRLGAKPGKATAGLARRPWGNLVACLALITILSLPTGCSSSDRPGPQEVVTDFFQDIKAGRIGAAHRHFGKSHRALLSRERFATLVKNLPLLKEHAAVTVTRVGSGPAPLPVHVQLTSASGEKTHVSLYLFREEESWVLGAMHFDVATDFPSAPDGSAGGRRGSSCSSNREGGSLEVSCKMLFTLSQPPVDQERCSYELVVDCEVSGPDGQRAEPPSSSWTDAFEQDCNNQYRSMECVATLSPDFPPGPYALRVRVTDRSTGATFTHELAHFVHQ